MDDKEGLQLAATSSTRKPNKSGEVATTGMRIEGTQFRSTNITLRILLEQAYGMWQDSQLIGGP